MKNFGKFALLALAASALSVPAHAQNKGQDSLVQYSQENFVKYDADHSSNLTFDEYLRYLDAPESEAQAKDSFARLDTNKDNFLSAEELRGEPSPSAPIVSR